MASKRTAALGRRHGQTDQGLRGAVAVPVAREEPGLHQLPPQQQRAKRVLLINRPAAPPSAACCLHRA
jgi:hypothetical protein